MFLVLLHILQALVKACSSLKAAVEDSEIVFEAVVEDLAIKRRVFAGKRSRHSSKGSPCLFISSHAQSCGMQQKHLP